MKHGMILTLMMACAFAPVVHAGGGPDRHNPQQWHASGPGHNNHRAPSSLHSHQHGNGYGNHAHYGKPGGMREHFSWRGRDYRKGQPAPQRFRGQRYRVNDWHARGLHQPPSGHYWTRIDGNYVLIAATTGIITGILLGNIFSR